MTIVVLLILAGVWGVVLYGYAKDRLADVRPADSIGSFRRQLSILERTGPVDDRIAPVSTLVRATPAATSASPSFRPVPTARRYRASMAAKRRRDIFFSLLSLMAGSLVLGFVPALRVMWGLHLVLDALFAGYVYLLARRRNIGVEQTAKVRYVPQAAPPAEPALLLRRTGS